MKLKLTKRANQTYGKQKRKLSPASQSQKQRQTKHGKVNVGKELTLSKARPTQHVPCSAGVVGGQLAGLKVEHALALITAATNNKGNKANEQIFICSGAKVSGSCEQIAGYEGGVDSVGVCVRVRVLARPIANIKCETMAVRICGD